MNDEPCETPVAAREPRLFGPSTLFGGLLVVVLMMGGLITWIGIKPIIAHMTLNEKQVADIDLCRRLCDELLVFEEDPRFVPLFERLAEIVDLDQVVELSVMRGNQYLFRFDRKGGAGGHGLTLSSTEYVSLLKNRPTAKSASALTFFLTPLAKDEKEPLLAGPLAALIASVPAGERQRFDLKPLATGREIVGLRVVSGVLTFEAAVVAGAAVGH